MAEGSFAARLIKSVTANAGASPRRRASSGTVNPDDQVQGDTFGGTRMHITSNRTDEAVSGRRNMPGILPSPAVRGGNTPGKGEVPAGGGGGGRVGSGILLGSAATLAAADARL